MDESQLTTLDLVERIRERWGYQLHRSTVGLWTRREDNPLPIAYQGLNGQAHRFDWAEALPWLESEFAAQATASLQDIDQMDLRMAQTLRTREQAKQETMRTRERAGDLVSRAEVERQAEDLAATAAQMLLCIPDRISAVLAHESDETRVAQLLDKELRMVCNMIADSSRGGEAEEAP